MTQNRNEKRAARQFMRDHPGISYTAALRAVREVKDGLPISAKVQEQRLHAEDQNGSE